MIKGRWRRTNERKEVKKNSYYSDKFYKKCGSTVSLLCIAIDKLLNDSPSLDTSVEVPSVHRQKAATK